MSEAQLFGLLLLAAIIFVVCVAMVVRWSRAQHRRLRRRFGAEYDRAIDEYGQVDRRERELERRAMRVQRLKLRELNAREREQYAAVWRQAQALFVDQPALAVQKADELIQQVMHSRGYPVQNLDERDANLSVDHGNVVHHYRAARSIARASRSGNASTKDHRQAFVHYRVLFAELLAEQTVNRSSLQEVHA